MSVSKFVRLLKAVYIYININSEKKLKMLCSVDKCEYWCHGEVYMTR